MDNKQYLDFIEKHKKEIKSYEDYAFDLHDNKVNQRYGNLPYSYHLKNVYTYTVSSLWMILQDEEHILPVLFGALFHDSMEDARLTYNDVKNVAKDLGMNKEQQYMAAEIVYALTNEKGRTRKERADDRYYKGIRETPYAPFVKFCDRIANMVYSGIIRSDMLKMYQDEMSHFLESILGGDGCYSIPNELIEFSKTIEPRTWD